MFKLMFRRGKLKVKDWSEDKEISIPECVIEPHNLEYIRHVKAWSLITCLNGSGYFTSLEVKRSELLEDELRIVTEFDLVKLKLIVYSNLDVILGSGTLRENLKVLDITVKNRTENDFKRLSEFSLSELYINKMYCHKFTPYQSIYEGSKLQESLKVLDISGFEIENDKSIEILARLYSLKKLVLNAPQCVTNHIIDLFGNKSRLSEILKELTINLEDGVCSDEEGKESTPLGVILKNEKLQENLERLGVGMHRIEMGYSGYKAVKNISLLSQFKKLKELVLKGLNISIEEIFIENSNITNTLESLTLYFHFSRTLSLKDLKLIVNFRKLKNLSVRCKELGDINIDIKMEKDKKLVDRLSELERFHFSYSNYICSEKGLIEARQLRNLPITSLRIGLAYHQSGILPSLLGSGSESTTLSSHLVSLTLVRIIITMDGLTSLSKCGKLERLCLRNCRMGEDLLMGDLSKADIKLKELYLRDDNSSGVSLIVELFREKVERFFITSCQLKPPELENIISQMKEGSSMEVMVSEYQYQRELFKNIEYDQNRVHSIITYTYTYYFGGTTRFSERALRTLIPSNVDYLF